MSDLVIDGSVEARAPVNIALVKYWGKAPSAGPGDANLPAVPSLSLTLDNLHSQTRVRFAPEADGDRVTLDGVQLAGDALARGRAVLDRVRSLAGVSAPFLVESVNHVPTAAGLASSASGMAALAGAAARCAGLTPQPEALSALARLGSGSAARSVFGGWVCWEGANATPLAPESHWDVRLVVAVIAASPKEISSRDAMNLTARTSPYYGGWVAQATASFDAGRRAVMARDLESLADVMERSALRMHACAMAADPPVLYWRPASLGVIEAARRLRERGTRCGWTMDAGPNVKILCEAQDADVVGDTIRECPGVERVIRCAPGPGLQVKVVPE